MRVDKGYLISFGIMNFIIGCFMMGDHGKSTFWVVGMLMFHLGVALDNREEK